MRTLLTTLLAGFVCAGTSAARAAPAIENDGTRYVEAVRRFADLALAEGRDTLGPKQTPLFLDGLEVQNHQPIRWPSHGEVWVLANPASQQNLLRTLAGLTALTGEGKYREAAVAATRFTLDHLQSDTGLIYWGGHTAYDALGDRTVTEAGQHELKRHYPFYELMWEVNPAKTQRFVEAFWNAHIIEWSTLEFNRHGDYAKARGSLWASDYRGGPVFFKARGLSFVNTGSDLFFASSLLHEFTGQAGPLVWAKRLAHRYVETRNSVTGLGGYVFSSVAAGDRGTRQFGPEFGDRAKEGTVLDTTRAPTKFAHVPLCLLMLGERLGDQGRDFTQWGVEELTAFGHHAYDPATNQILPMITDGTRLAPSDVKRSGYFQAVSFVPRPAGGIFLRAYAFAWRVTGDPFFWEMLRSIARGNDLGDFGAAAGDVPALNERTACADPDALHALLELFQRSGRTEFRRLAEKIGDNILADRVRNSLFVPDAKARFTRLDHREPLALLRLAAVLRNQPGAAPQDWGGEPNFACFYADRGRQSDNEIIYQDER